MDLEGGLARFARDGFARLGQVLTEEAARALRARTEAIMLAETPDSGIFFQHDSPTGRYEDLVFGHGWVGPSLAYRKLEKMERDPLFRWWIENPLFARIAHAVLGPRVALYRAVLWNKAAEGGVDLPWHQDDGRFWGIDRSPVLQIWTAIDEAPEASGCLKVLAGSHLGGLASPEGGTVPAACLQAADAEERALTLPARAGEVILIHNHLWHRSGRNTTDRPRRALGISYLSGETQCRRERRQRRQFLAMFDRP
jgi:hypothetical protein